jgi:PAS domain-containing protein
MFGLFKFKDYPQTVRLALMLVLFFALPMATLGYLGLGAISTVRSEFDGELSTTAKRAADTIDRNLFERYGDVQAFGLNTAVQDRSQWYLEGESALRSAMNAYVDTYDLYFLTILVDTDGKVIAVNDKDASGKNIDTKFLHGQSLADTAWFQALRSGQYTTKQKYTASGNDQVTGTFIEDAHVDPIVRRAYGNGDALTLGFSAPVKDAQGKTIAYWSNRATFKIVGDIVTATQARMVALGRPQASVSVLRLDGSPLVTIKPEEDKAFGEADLRALANGVDAWLGTDVAGHGEFLAANGAQLGGASRLTGVLGYPGMPWSVAVTVPESNPGSSFAELARNMRNASIALFGLVTPLALLLLRNRKRDEDNLREQHARELAQKDEVRRIQSVVDLAPNPTMILDNDFRIVYVNNATTQQRRLSLALKPICHAAQRT